MRLRRLQQMSVEEVQWRAGEAVRTVAERVGSRLGTPRWERRSLRDALAAGVLDASSQRDLEQGHWLAVHDALSARITARQPRFILDPSSLGAMRTRVATLFPDAHLGARMQGERLLARTFDLLGHRGVACVDGVGGVDWHADPVHGRRSPLVFYADVPYLDPAVGDHKVIWELNRHQHWLALGRAAWLTGDVRFAREIGAQLESWLAGNPPLTGINWASMLEIGLRAISWTWALHCLIGVDSPLPDSKSQSPTKDLRAPWIVDLLVGLDRQLRHVERHLSYYFSPNTHLTGEALSLYVVGTALPELRASQRWVATGRRILLAEIDRQILPDGGHAERSTHYQRYTLDFYLLATRIARLAADGDAERAFQDAAIRLAAFTRTIADDEGRLPLIGDDDGGMLWPIAGRACNDVRDSLGVAAVMFDRPDLAPWGITEEVLWIAGPDVAHLPVARERPSSASRLLSDAGYFVARGPDGSHAVLDVGPHGFMNGGHAHADALSLTLALRGEPLLVDPGTSTYTMDRELRDRMRSSISHNTLTLDGRSQSLPAGPFHWRSVVDAEVTAWGNNPSFDWVEGRHDGYHDARHSRTLLRTIDAGWLVVDVVSGSPREGALHWHFDPRWQVTLDEGRVRAVHASGREAWLLHDGSDVALFHGDRLRGLGWCAPVYGQLVPTWTARVTPRVAGPLAVVTWIGDSAGFKAPRLHSTRVDTLTDACIVAEVVEAERKAVFMVRSADSRAGRPPCRVGDYESDARILRYLESNGDLRSLSIAGAQHAVTARDGWPSLVADGPLHDLHATIGDHVIELESAVPPAALTLQGIGGRVVRVNGRELPLSSNPTTDTLLIHGAEWRQFSRMAPASGLSEECGAGFARH